MKSWIFRSDGTVTIFCTLIMMFLTLFLMILVDYARILLFQRTTESALKLSAQSVISAYDRELYTRYGLFARGGSQSEQLFSRAMELNLANSYSIFSLQQGSDFVQPKLERFEIFAGDYLGQHHIFEQQVLEEMKYKAPIDFTIELVEQWLPLQSAVEKADNIMRVLDELETLFAEREEKLDQVLQLQQRLGTLLRKSHFHTAVTTSAASTLHKYDQYILWLQYRANISGQIEELRRLRDNDSGLLLEEEQLHVNKQISDLEAKRDSYDSQINSYVQTAVHVSALISNNGADLLSESEQLAEQIYDLLQGAKALDNTIHIKYELYLKGSTAEQPEAASRLESELSQLDFDESMIRGERYYNEYRDAVAIQHQTIEEIISDGSNLASQINSLTNHPNINNEVSNQSLHKAKQLAEKLNKDAEQYVVNYEAPATLLAQWEREMSGSREVRGKIVQYEQQFQEAVSALDSISELFQAEGERPNAQADYTNVKQRFQSNYERNAGNDSSDYVKASLLSGSGKKQAASAMSILSRILQTMDSAAASIRDHVYINEYIMSRFSSFPMGELTSENKMSGELMQLDKQEVEYILYGVHEPLANVVLAYGEIFAIRLAIRTIEGFIANRGLTHPLLILGAAIAYGVRQTIQDMKELMQEGTTELSRYAPVKIDYDNYLRLFLLLHIGHKEVKLSKIIALIEHDIDVSLFAVPTSVTAHAELSMKLWALPGLAAIAGAISPRDSEVDGNVYKRTELVSASY